MCVNASLLAARTVYDSAAGGWRGNASVEPAFATAQRSLRDWNDFMLQDMGRNGWDGNGGGMLLTMSSQPHPRGYAATGGGGGMTIYSWAHFDTERAPGVVRRDWLIGHEGTHSIMLHDVAAHGARGDFNGECLSENLSDLWGSLFSRSLHPDSDEAFDGNPAWVNLRYAQRSHFDFAACPAEGALWTDQACRTDGDCPAYYGCRLRDAVGARRCGRVPDEHNNGGVWGRELVRLLALGTGALPAGVDLGVRIPALGVQTAIDVLYGASTSVLSPTTQLEWAELVLSESAALGNDVKWATMFALGAIGFPQGPYRLANVGTSVPGRVLTWREWQGPTQQTFYAYRDAATNRIKMWQWRNGVGPVDVFVSAGPAGTPVLAAYDSRLHVMWRDPATAEIRVRRLRPNGVWEAEQSLGAGGPGLTTSGNFDAVVFDGSLTLGFVRSGAGTLSVARCRSNDATGCSAAIADWTAYPGGFSKDLGRATSGGVALEAATGVNGAGAGEHLFALTADPADGRLRIVRVGRDDSVVDERLVPDTYPSYRADADAPRGLVARKASRVAEGRYLMLSWNGRDVDRIWTSVLQDWGASQERSWITRSAPMIEQAVSGVTFARGEPDHYVRYVYSDWPGMRFYTTYLWARY
jgi:hypothetical protein